MSDIDEVKSRLNIVDIISPRVHLKKAGRNFKGLCPFHNEKTPSFIVSPERQIFHCFGCGKGGSVIDFIMEYDHIDFTEALESLAEKAGVKLTRRAPESAEGKLKQKLYEVNHLASEFYHYLLTKHRLGEIARRYLKERGVSDKSMTTFTLGYSPNSWDGLLKFLLKKGYDEKLLETAGLVLRTQNAMTRTQKFYDRFRGRVMFTLKDHRGQVVGFAGRILNKDIKEAKYINTNETPVYVKSNVLYGLDVTKEAISKGNDAVVMEGELDVISSFQAGIPNVVAIKGSALTEGHVRLLRRFTDRIAFALDSDVAGDAAARRGIEIAEKAGLDMRVVILPSGKDPDEAARTNSALLKKAIKEAIPIYDYFIRSAMSRFDGGTAYGKKKIGEEIVPILSTIENGVVLAHYTKQLAKALDVTEETITEAIDKRKRVVAKGMQPTEAISQNVFVRTRPEKLELYILALVLQGDTRELYEDFMSSVNVTDFSQRAVRHILENLGIFLKTHKKFLLKDFADSSPTELSATFDEAFLWDIADLLSDEKRMSREWSRAILAFQKVVLRRKIVEVTALVRERDNKKENTEEIQRQLKKLTEALSTLEKQNSI